MLIDGAEIIENVGPIVLSRAIVRPRRRVEGIFPLLRIYDRKEHQSLLRWDEVFIRPASRAGEIGVEECLDQSSPIRIPLAKRGDTLIIDNWRMLHGRSTGSQHFIPAPLGYQTLRLTQLSDGVLQRSIDRACVFGECILKKTTVAAAVPQDWDAEALYAKAQRCR